MRQALAAHTGLAVLLAFFSAPFLHVHTAEVDDHHRDGPAALQHGAIVHAHFPGAPAAERDGTDISRTEEREISVNVFGVILKQPALPDLPFLIAARSEVEPPVPSVVRIVLQFTPRTHGPPPLEASNPRAPPA